jgi:hypothetical protein
MKKRVSLLVAAVFAVSAFASVSQASAATEFGSACTGTAGESVASSVSISHGAGSPLPVAAPVSGVITEWRTTVQLGEGPVPPEAQELLGPLYRQGLQVYRPAGGDSYTLVGESLGGPLNLSGTSSYPARVPVQAGDHLGLGGTFFTFYCPETGDAADVTGFVVGTPSIGSTKEFEVETEFQVPVVAKIEPDVDGDGYGDETQDQCPQSAAYQTACPVVTISSLPTTAKNVVTLHVATSLSAPVGVTATVPLGKGKTATLTAAAQTVAPGTLAAFTLTLTPEVTKALKALPTKKSLTMSITASATNVTGSPSTSATTVPLQGQAKPKPKPKHHKKHKKSKAK